jgi:hypothetical protein
MLQGVSRDAEERLSVLRASLSRYASEMRRNGVLESWLRFLFGGHALGSGYRTRSSESQFLFRHES